MLGVELVKDRETKEPAKEECAAVFEACKDMGLLIGKGGLWGNTLRIKPPMIFSATDADFMLAVLDEALALGLGDLQLDADLERRRSRSRARRGWPRRCRATSSGSRSTSGRG